MEKKNKKMVEVNSNTSIITLNVKDLNTPIKGKSKKNSKRNIL